MWKHALSVLALLGASSCGEPSAAPARGADPARGSDNGGGEVVDEVVAEWMRSHFLAGREIRDALVRGELDDARARLAVMGTEAGPPGAPASWEPRLEVLRASAREAATARGLPDVARAFGDVGSACAGCHTALEVQPEFDSEAIPPAAEDAPAAMRRHQWAAERMWQGLVGPAADRYREGALVLAEAPLHPAELVVGQAPPIEVAQLAERVRDVAGQASRAASDEERAALYGRLLATCAACHSQQ